MALNKIYIEGKIIESKHDRETKFDNGKIISTSLMVSQKARKGTGYNGSDYTNVFYSLEYSQRLSDPKISDKSRVLVEGELLQNKGKDGKTYFKIKAKNITTLIESNVPNIAKPISKELTQEEINEHGQLFED